MNTRLLIALGALLAAPAFSAGTDTSGSTQTIHYSRKQLHERMRRAHTADDYRALATYFRMKASEYRSKAQQDEVRYENALNTLPVPKHPTPAETAKWFYEYDTSKANEMETLSKRYNEKLEATGSDAGHASAAPAGHESQTALTPAEAQLLHRLEAVEQQVHDLQK